MIEMRPDHLALVKQILAQYAPGCEVRAFGSRVRGTAKDHSDLDPSQAQGRLWPWLAPDPLKRDA